VVASITYSVVFCILFITCVSIVIVLHSLYRAAVSVFALLSSSLCSVKLRVVLYLSK